MMEQEQIQTNAQPQVQPQEERVFKQSELNEIVGRVRRETAERFQNQGQAQQSSGISADEVRRLAAEELERQRSKWMEEQENSRVKADVQRIVNAYQSKTAGIEQKYTDFADVAQGLDMSRYPSVVKMLADNVDNASDVLYELAKSRSKLAILESAYQLNPDDAIYDITKLSKSIKTHQEASSVKQAQSPLSQQRPSSGMGESQVDMKSLRAKYRA